MAAINVVKKRGTSLLAGRNKLAFDYWLLLATGALLVIGFLMVYSTTFDLGDRFEQNPVYFVTRQLVAMALGVGVIVVLMQFDYHILRYLSVPLILFIMAVLFLMLIFGQVDEYGAVRTISDGSYQPSELAKLAMILYIAHWLDSKGDRIKSINYGLAPFAAITGIMFGLIVFQPALSAAILIVLISFTLFFVAGADLKQVIVAGVLAVVVVGIMMVTLPHASQRIDDYMAAFRDPQQASYQVRQALGFRVASHARDTYGFLLAVGITVWISYQALINIAVITAVIPFTGMPMPFLSYGGSSMLMTMIAVGILLNVSRDAALGRQPTRRQPRNG
jgi:cell division protein FtsW